MSEIEELELRIKEIDGIKIVDMDIEQLKTFVLTLNSKILILENSNNVLRESINELKDNLKGFRSGITERYITNENFSNTIQSLLNRVMDNENKIEFTAKLMDVGVPPK